MPRALLISLYVHIFCVHIFIKSSALLPLGHLILFTDEEKIEAPRRKRPKESKDLCSGKAAPSLPKPPHYSQEEPHEGKFSLK
jgi:hypothetical protein